MEDRAIHTSPTRWLHYYSSTTDTANSGLQKVDTRWLNKTYFPKQAIQLESFEGDNLITQSKPSMFSRLLSKFRSIGKKEIVPPNYRSLSILSEKIHKNHSVSAFFPSTTSKETPYENIFSPLVDKPMDTIDTIQKNNCTMAFIKHDCRTESNFFSSDFFRDSVRPVIDYDESEITD